jgi:hypothetical protein
LKSAITPLGKTSQDKSTVSLAISFLSTAASDSVAFLAFIRVTVAAWSLKGN